MTLTVNGVAEFKKRGCGQQHIRFEKIILAESSKFIGIPLSEKNQLNPK